MPQLSEVRAGLLRSARKNRNVQIANWEAPFGQAYLLEVADQFFRGDVLQEKVFAVMLLEGMTGELGSREFKLFESWLDRVTSRADHDGLVHYLIGPMIAADSAYLVRPLRWAKKKSTWHQRAAAVSLIHSTRQHKNFEHIRHIAELLLTSDDDTVQKSLGWLRKPIPNKRSLSC